jgi:WD40 repeat protein/beta-lactamase regulating signal transducer with metallopeptidase domain
MKVLESMLAGGPWAVVTMVQLTLLALLGLLAWLLARRGRPALRGAVLLATLVGLLVVPGLAAVAPAWLPLPAFLGLPDPVLARDGADDVPAAPPPAPAAEVASLAVLVEQPPAKNTPDTARPAPQSAETTGLRTQAVVITVSLAQADVTPPPRAPAAARTAAGSPMPSVLAGVLAAVWLLGALACLGRALVRLGLLYRCARRARAVHEREWTDCVASLAQCHGLAAVALRESAAVVAPFTLGFFRPVIVLPTGRRGWSAGARALILNHELAHVRRRDFLAGLAAEVAACLCWFHPLVHWLAGRLRLEQEFAADAWVASAAADTTDYVQCLARLALELNGGRGSLAPAFWRRRPEILRRIDMLQRNTHGTVARLGRRTSWTVALLAAAATVAVAGAVPRQAAGDGRQAAPAGSEPGRKATADVYGDPLPAGALARLGTTRLRHGADVTFVAFGPGGRTLLTAGQDNTIRLWDLATGKEVRRFTRPRALARKEVKPQPGQQVEVEVENIVDLLAMGQGDGGRFSVAVAPDGKTLAAASGNVIQLWDVETGKALRRIEAQADGLASLLFSPDGRTLAGRAGGGLIGLWAADTGKEIQRLKPPARKRGNGVVFIIGGGGDEAPGMAFTPDGKTLVAVARDNREEGAVNLLKFWDVASGKEVRRVKAPPGANVSALAVAPGGKVLAYGGGDAVHLCAMGTGKELRQLKTGDGGARALVFAPDGRTLAVRGRGDRVRLWEVASGKELRHLSDADAPQGRRAGLLALFSDSFSGPGARALAVSPDGRRIAAAAGSTVRLWETATGKEVALNQGARRAPAAVILSSDGKVVVSWGFDGVVRRWEATMGQPRGAFPAPRGTTLAAFAPDAGTVALANADNTIRLHDTATGKELRRLSGHQSGCAALAFAPGGKLLASRDSGDNAIRLYDVARGTEVREILVRPRTNQGNGMVLILGGPARALRGTGPGLAFSPDGSLLAVPVAGDSDPADVLAFFDVATGKELRKIQSPQPIASFAFSPDGRVLAAENADRTVTLWEVASARARGRLGKPVAEQPARGGMAGLRVVISGVGTGTFTEPGGPVGLSFSPDGRALAVRGPDLSVRLWAVDAGREVGRLSGHGGNIETVAFAPDGKTLASGATDTTILLWDAAEPLKQLPQPQVAELTAAQVAALWKDLAREDAAKALRSVHELASDPGQAVRFLAGRVKPAARIDPQRINGWITGLESEKFAVRQDAAANLLKAGGQAVPALRQVLASTPPLETRRRVEELLDRLTGGTLTTEQLRLVRAVEALERMHTPEAGQLLRTLAAGAPGALATREAQAALDRLAARQP